MSRLDVMARHALRPQPTPADGHRPRPTGIGLAAVGVLGAALVGAGGPAPLAHASVATPTTPHATHPHRAVATPPLLPRRSSGTSEPVPPAIADIWPRGAGAPARRR